MRGTVRYACAALAALTLRAGTAAADDLNIYLEPQYSDITREDIDAAGHRTTDHSQVLDQKYRLTLNRALLPGLRLDGLGMLEDTRAVGTPSALYGGATQATTLNLNLTFGDRIMGGRATYLRRQDTPLRTPQLALVNDNYSLSLTWGPEAAPAVGLRLSRMDVHDRDRLTLDRTTDQALVSMRYLVNRQLRMTGSVGVTNDSDRVGGANVRALDGNASVNWDDVLFGGRTTASASYILGARASDAATTSAQGSVSAQQLPVPGAGLSRIDDLTDVATLTRLDPNPALVDGNTAASASLNLGYGPGPASDTRFREMGAEFPDVRTEVNVVWVWVDRPPSTAVAAAFATGWSVYQSDDNGLTGWRPVNVTGAAVVPPFQSRFEIPIAKTTARYLKVVRAPLLVGVTLDPQFRDMFVTEIQFVLKQFGAEARGRSSTVQNRVSASARTPISPVAGLVYDVSGFVRRSDAFGDAAQAGITSWTVTNGLSLSRKPWSNALFNGSLVRQDSDDGVHYRGSFLWGASLALRPLTTLANTLSYSGMFAQGAGTTTTQNMVSLYNHAEIYRWLAADANGSYSVLSDSLTGGSTQSTSVDLMSSVTLHPTLRISGLWRLRRTWGISVGRGQLVQGEVSFSPTVSTALSASVIRIIEGPRPTTLGTVAAALSPFQGGALEFRANATRTLDSSAQQIVTSISPGVRWNIRTGWYFDLSYTYYDTDAPIGRSRVTELLGMLVALF